MGVTDKGDHTTCNNSDYPLDAPSSMTLLGGFSGVIQLLRKIPQILRE